MKIGISLPVHERVDVILNQIINIYKFIDDPLICIHVSKNSSINHDELSAIAKITGIIINENCLATNHGSGLMGVHVSNYQYMKKLYKNKIDYMLLLSSNEMLIKPNLDSYISKFDLGIQIVSKNECPTWHLFNKGIEHVNELKNFMKIIGVSQIKGGQAEGQFFKTDLFEKLSEAYESCFDKNYFGFETEEILPATFFSQDKFKSHKFSPPITLQNYCLNLNIDLDMVNRIRANVGYISADPIPRTLLSPHLGIGKNDSIFSVKRVERTINDLRIKITNMPKFIREENI